MAVTREVGILLAASPGDWASYIAKFKQRVTTPGVRFTELPPGGANGDQGLLDTTAALSFAKPRGGGHREHPGGAGVAGGHQGEPEVVRVRVGRRSHDQRVAAAARRPLHRPLEPAGQASDAARRRDAGERICGPVRGGRQLRQGADQDRDDHRRQHLDCDRRRPSSSRSMHRPTSARSSAASRARASVAVCLQRLADHQPFISAECQGPLRAGGVAAENDVRVRRARHSARREPVDGIKFEDLFDKAAEYVDLILGRHQPGRPADLRAAASRSRAEKEGQQG